jgi:uncharacterized membrane protein YesL
MRGLMGGFYRISEWIMRLAVINILWILFSFPFFLLLMTALFSPTMGVAALQQWLFTMAVIAPFTLVPATAAMFTIARKWTTGEADAPLWGTFWRGYKENYRQSMLGSIIFLVIGIMLVVNYQFYMHRTGMLAYLSIMFLVLIVFLVAAFINFLSILVHFHMKLLQLVKNSLLITVGQPFNTIFLLVANAIVLYVSLFKFTFLIPFFMGSLMALASFWTFHRGFTRIQDRAKSQAEDEEADQDSDEESNEESNDSDTAEDNAEKRLSIPEQAKEEDGTDGEERK